MKKNVFVTGSLAYDHISNFHDKFSNHILPNKIHVLNVSFTTSNLKKQFGGTATNIAYNLKMLGLEPNIFSAAGKDFAEYQAWLNKHRIKTNYITKVKDDFTAVANIITDEDDNQINSFYSGALGKKRPSIKTALKKEKPVLGIISPDNPVMMISYAQDFTFAKLPFIFDPGQIIPALSKSEIMFCLKNAMMMIVNDYELSLIKDKTGLTLNEIKNKLKYLIVTLGPKGSLIYHTGKKYQIPVAKPKNTSDPTGAGDAYRAGIIKGLIEGFEIETMGRVAALASVYTVEKYGTQTHSYSATSFKKRYKENFSENLTCL